MRKKQLLNNALPALLLILAGVLAYWNSFDGVFVYDDMENIRDNTHIRVMRPISEAMSLPLWGTALTVDRRPLLSLSFALNHALFGADPWGYHLVNLLIHIGAGLLLFGIVWRTLALPRFREWYASSATWLALAVAGIWLVHPLQTESVTYIVQRAESLMGMFFLLTMYCSIRGFRTQGSGGRGQGLWHIVAVVSCALGMGVKEVMFVVPILVLLYDWIFISESSGKALSKRRLLYVGLFSTWSIIFAIKYLGWAESTDYSAAISPVRYALTQPLVILHYLRLAVWPSPLVLEYGWPLETEWHRIVFPGLAILVMLAVMCSGIYRRKWYGFAAAWFFLILAPTSTIVPLRQAIFEHRMYLSLAVVVLLAVMGCEYVIRRLSADPKRQAMIGGCLGLAVVIVLGYLTHDRNKDYHSQVSIWQDAVAHRPDNPLAHLNLGHAVQESDRPLEAIPHYREALRLKPDYAEAHYDWGVALDTAGKLREAIEQYQQALRLRPDYARAHNNLGNALLLAGHPMEAVEHCLEALRIKPELAKAHNNLGNAMLALGRPLEAIMHYREALRIDPLDAEAHYNWGLALDATGKPREAIAHYHEAAGIDPDLIGARYNLGNALLALGRYSEAIKHYEQVVQLKPDHAEAHNNLAIALQELGRSNEAVAHGLQAVRINPAIASFHCNLGVIYQESGRLTEAIRHFEEAVRLRPEYPVARENLRETRTMVEEEIPKE